MKFLYWTTMKLSYWSDTKNGGIDIIVNMNYYKSR